LGKTGENKDFHFSNRNEVTTACFCKPVRDDGPNAGAALWRLLRFRFQNQGIRC
jgi:hypothetical protein